MEESLRRSCLLALALATGGLAWGHGGDGESAPSANGSSHDRFIFGEGARVGGRRVTTWAVLTSNGKIEEVGVTIPLSVFVNQPGPGDGPLRAIASLKFPEVVRQATFFDHFEMHSNPIGHPAPPSQPNRYFVPHFDFHFYNVPEAVVWGIPALPPPLAPVPADRLPVGWFQPGGSDPQMGRHAAPMSIASGPFTADMIAGFLPSGGRMHFIEPMITTAFLTQATSFEMTLPRPAVFGRVMLYPEKFSAEYDAKLAVYHFVFRQFVTVE